MAVYWRTREEINRKNDVVMAAKKDHKGRTIALTQEEFLERARAKHGDRYDYSLTEYNGAHSKIFIICRIHGVFNQVASEHITGSGCSLCANKSKSERMRTSINGEPKICPSCNRSFPHTDEFFYKKSANVSGLDCYCKECSAKKRRELRKNNPELYKKYGHQAYIRRKTTGKAKNYVKHKRNNNLSVKIQTNLQNELRYALQSSGVSKTLSSLELFGCLREFLVKYLEQFFIGEMSWENYGKKGWWVDHIRPCASFNLIDPEEQKKCFHYTNLRPMWYKDNIKKSSWYMGKKYVYKK